MPNDPLYEASSDLLEIVERYTAGEKVKDLSTEYDIPTSTIYYAFKQMGVETSGSTRLSGKAGKVIRKIEVDALAEEAEKIGTIAVKLGGVIARRYLPLLDDMMSQNKTLEMIAEEVMSFYESKRSFLRRMEGLESEVIHLQEQLEYAYGLALPNYRYELRTRILERYAKKLLDARMIGVRLPVKRSLKAFHTDLLLLEQNIEDIIME